MRCCLRIIVGVSVGVGCQASPCFALARPAHGCISFKAQSRATTGPERKEGAVVRNHRREEERISAEFSAKVNYALKVKVRGLTYIP